MYFNTTGSALNPWFWWSDQLYRAWSEKAD